jgi:hypothetical protein
VRGRPQTVEVVRELVELPRFGCPLSGDEGVLLKNQLRLRGIKL